MHFIQGMKDMVAIFLNKGVKSAGVCKTPKPPSLFQHRGHLPAHSHSTTQHITTHHEKTRITVYPPTPSASQRHASLLLQPSSNPLALTNRLTQNQIIKASARRSRGRSKVAPFVLVARRYRYTYSTQQRCRESMVQQDGIGARAFPIHSARNRATLLGTPN